ncbi:hypothetical protein EASAB2608_08155 [Streptomyces sp. EAS-AB2608]|uniref:hypothetical protein n=1 Tax=Streptomyces sp. EAS-AB2608 TaxID=2779671 RepID=UPI00073DF829|nr:hypothetical protein [Streptomyces sp. EAS-AB2608]BCM72821.1 hypothetical protein EASAB2608_08155 [Streptomyces sp. EAS-AB2608]CUW33103.1 hypothetical protein TUE45_pSRTUE45c_0471 [Streptomyces reticuli]
MSMTQTGKLQPSSTNAAVVTGGDTSTFTQVTFPSPFPANAAVIVIPSVQTFNGPETPGLRIADVTTTGFKMRPRDRLSPHQSCDSGPGKGYGDLPPRPPRTPPRCCAPAVHPAWPVRAMAAPDLFLKVSCHPVPG